jgi:hypothetical protein
MRLFTLGFAVAEQTGISAGSFIGPVIGAILISMTSINDLLLFFFCISRPEVSVLIPIPILTDEYAGEVS